MRVLIAIASLLFIGAVVLFMPHEPVVTHPVPWSIMNDGHRVMDRATLAEQGGIGPRRPRPPTPAPN